MNSSEQRLQRLGNLYVFLITALIQIDLLALDRLETGSGHRRLARRQLAVEHRGFQFVLRVMCALPRQPLGRPLRVCRLYPLRAERERPTARCIQQREFRGQHLTRGARERDPRHQHARIGVSGSDSRRERLQHRECASARGLGSCGPQFRHERARRPQDRRRYDDRRRDRDQYWRTAETCSPASFARPFSATSSIRNARPWTWPPTPRTRSSVARAVPPVASRSSTISTRCPGWTASWCISSVSVPYSRE